MWFKEKDFIIKMGGNVNFSKDEIMTLIENGYKVKVGKKSYMIFEEIDHYLNLFYLEKVYSEYYNELISMEIDDIIDKGYDEETIIFLISLIEKYIETFPLIKIIVYYDDDEDENPFLIKFPNVGELDTVFNKNIRIEENKKKIQIAEKLHYIENEDLSKKYSNSISLLREKIKVKYIIKNEYNFTNF